MSLRVVHTSDWHLGHTLASHSRAHEHARFFAWLLDLLEEEGADALLVSGDVYDRVIPPSSAVRSFYAFLEAAHARCPELDIVVTGGNHDGAARLEAPAEVVERRIRLIGGYDEARPERVRVPLTDRDGDVAAQVVAMPFLRPGDYPASLGTAEGYAAVYQRALDAAREHCRGGEALLAMGHCHMAGGALQHTDSERPVLRGGEEAVPAGIFGDDVAYVALGHLHLAQPVGSEHVRYCGSPIPLSMSEAGYPHQVLVVDIEGSELREVQSRAVPRSVPMRRFEGTLDSVVQAIGASDLPDAEAPGEEHAFVDVRLTELAPRARDRVREALAPFGARLVAVRIDAPIGQMTGPSTVSAESGLQTFEPEQVFAALHDRRRGGPPDGALVTRFRELLREAQSQESSPA